MSEIQIVICLVSACLLGIILNCIAGFLVAASIGRDEREECYIIWSTEYERYFTDFQSFGTENSNPMLAVRFTKSEAEKASGPLDVILRVESDEN